MDERSRGDGMGDGMGEGMGEGMGAGHDHAHGAESDHDHDPGAMPAAEGGTEAAAPGGPAMSSGPADGSAMGSPAAAAPPMGSPAAAAAAQTEAMRKRWEILGPNQRIAVAGGVAILVAYLAGILLEDWVVRLSSILLLAATVISIAVILVGTSRPMGMSRTLILRVDAGVVGAYSLYDLGDLISGISSWSTLDLVLTGVAVVGAALLVWGVWRMTQGNLVSDALGAAGGRGRELPARLVSIGSSVVIAIWFVLAILNYTFRTEIALTVLAAVLSLTVLWLAGSGAAEMKLPVAANLALAALGVIAGALTLVWFLGLLGELDGVEAVDWPFVLIFIAGSAAMTIGGLLGVGSRGMDAAT